MTKLLLAVLFTGCAVAESELEDSTIDIPLSGGVTLTEVSVPSSVQDAMLEVLGSPPTVRRFTINAPSSTTQALRLQGVFEGLYSRTRRGGSYAVKKYCTTLQPAATTPNDCAAAILAGPQEPGALDDHLEMFAGDVQANEVATVRSYLASTIGTPGVEHDLDVEQGHWEDGEYWYDNTSHRAVLVDATLSEVVIVRYWMGGSI
jgi:hypothetical protein